MSCCVNPQFGVPSEAKVSVKVSAVVAAPGAAPGSGIRYALTVRNEGAPGQDAMRAQLDALQKAFKDLEH